MRDSCRVDAAATKHPRRDDEVRYGLSLGSKPTEVAAQRSENDRASVLTRSVRLREGAAGLTWPSLQNGSRSSLKSGGI
jgi:hypothetical protein